MSMFFWTIYAFFVRIAQTARAWRLKIAAKTAQFARTPKVFVYHPEPKSIGSFTRGQQIAVGNFQFSGTLIEAPKRSIWDLQAPDFVVDEIHECAWVDDLAAVGTAETRRLLQSWVADWINRYGSGSGVGWQPGLTGRRLIHWVSHALLIMQGQDKSNTTGFLRSVARQARFLEKTWHLAPVGLPRIQALVGLVYVGLVLQNKERLLSPTIKRLGRECARLIGPDGSVESRSPEELMDVFILLVWAARVLEEAGKQADPRHIEALERIAPTLRVLRLGDGALVRCHGGGRGVEGRLDQALAESGIRAQAMRETRMGYTRLSSGRTIIIIDSENPASGAPSKQAHASTLAFEMSAGRFPVVVNTGPGRFFGPDWRRASRATACHSTLVLDNTSSSSIWSEGYAGNTFGERLFGAPTKTTLDRAHEVTGVWVLASHNGYAKTHGVTHDRRMFLSPNGREFRGEDTIFVANKDDRKMFDARKGDGLGYAIHFHLHPDVVPSLDMSGHAVSLKLKSEEIWVFRQTGGEITLEDAVYLDQQRLRPRQTKQIVIRGVMQDDRAQVTWAMTRAQEGKRYSMESSMAEDLEPLV